MKKALKIILSAICGTIIFIIMLPIIVSMLLQISSIQNFVVDAASQKLSEIAKTKISIGHVDIEFFTNAVLDDVYIEDYRGDTLIYAQNLKIAINGINFLTGKISLGSTTLSHGKVFLYKDSVGIMNIKEVFDNFKPEVPPLNPPDFYLIATELNLLHTHFKYHDVTADSVDYGVNFKNMEFFNITMQAKNISVINHNIWLAMEHLSLIEKSGFRVQHFSSKRCGVDSSGMYYANVLVETTNSTLHLDSLNFLTVNRSWWDWNDFEHKMILSARVKGGEVSSKTIEYLTHNQMAHPIQAQLGAARLWGPICDMQGKIDDLTTSGASVSAGFRITGLPDIKTTVFHAIVNPLTIHGAQIAPLIRKISGDTLTSDVVSIVERAGEVKMTASFDGTLEKFIGRAIVNTNCGSIIASINMSPNANSKNSVSVVNGVVKTDNFELGRMLNIEKMGVVSLTALVGIQNRGSHIRLSTQAAIDKLQYGTYDFNNIEINGDIAQNEFNGLISGNDPNLMFAARGKIKLTPDNTKYDININIENADLVAIGLNKRDSISCFSAELSANASGRTLDNLNGTASIDNILYINHLDTVRAAAINITSFATPDLKEIDIDSHFADISLRGRNSFLEVAQYFRQSLERFLPSFPDATAIVTGSRSGKRESEKLAHSKTSFPFSDGYYQFTVNVKQGNNVAGIFVPGLEIAQGSSLNFFFNPYLDQFNIRAHSELIELGDFVAENLNLESRNIGDSLTMFVSSDYLVAGGVDMPDFSLVGDVCRNVINLGGRFTSVEDATSALISTTTTFERSADGMAQMRVELHPTPIVISGDQWTVKPGYAIFDTTGIDLRGVGLYKGSQNLALDGKMSRSLQDTVSLELNRFDVSPASMLISSLGYKLRGTLGGSVRAAGVFGAMRLFASIDFNDLYLNNYPLGSPTLRSTLDEKNQRILFALGENLISAPIKGHYDFAQKRYMATFKFPSFDMAMLEPMMSGIMASTEGRANVDLKLTGGKDTPSLNGIVNIDNYTAMVDYTKVKYSLKGDVKVIDNNFYLASTPLSDGGRGTGSISAELKSDRFQDLTFDIRANFANLLALNTTATNNSSFYGKGYGTGNISIKGNESKTTINIVATTNEGTNFVLPLSDIATIENADFIKFVNPNAAPVVARKRKSSLGAKRREGQNELDLNIGLHITPAAQGLIEFNATMAQQIKGRAQGYLSMHINPTLDIMTINGPLEIVQGDYKFTLPPFYKFFTIESGGSLLWSGSPSNPQINMSAVYKVKTSLEPLGGQVTTANVDCGINLSGQLQTPTIKFNITAPSADAETQNLLRNSINTDETMATQFISLVLSKTLMPDVGAAIGTMGTSFVGNTGMEFLSNQLSQLISSDKVNIRFGYRPQSVATSDEFYAGVGGDIIRDVLSLEVDGNYNTGNNPSYNTRNPFTVDAYLTWNINKKGTLKLKGFTRTIDRFDETQGLQESGVGIYFKQDFSDWKDLQKRLKEYKMVRKANKEKKEKKEKSIKGEKKAKKERGSTGEVK